MNSGKRTRLRTPGHPILLLLTVLLAPALWVLFVGTTNGHEMIVGVVAAILTIAFMIFVGRLSHTELQFRARDLMEAWRIPWYVLSDAAIIVLVLFKDLASMTPAGTLYRVCGFDTSPRDPVRSARTVLAVVYMTCSPNSIVIGVDTAQSRVLFHQIEPSGIPRMMRALGAKA